MANGEAEQRASYPRIPAKIWWQLRSAAIKSPPKEITVPYLEALLGCSEGTAGNLIGNLRAIGLVGTDNKTTPVLHDWRDDEMYPDVCKKMVEKLYPEELRTLAPPPNPDRAQTARWFSRKTQTGDAAANQMAAFYSLLAKGDPKAPEVTTEFSDAPRPKVRPKVAPAKRLNAMRMSDVHGSREDDGEHGGVEQPRRPKNAMPSMHIDVQVHISPQASPEQIDAIFASMARHMYRE